jgi:carbon monoxide dehydrogenase subunit G
MEMSGEERIPATQDQTWAALNDPEILKACVPGCESIERVADNEYQILMVARIGPVSAKFKGKLALSDLKPPNSYAIAFEGQGGAAGFGKGSAQVRLAPDGAGTLLSYDVKANVGGKLAQIGSRLVDAAAKKISKDFFAAFNETVGGQHAAGGAVAQDAHGGHDEHDVHDDHAPGPVPRDPDLPTVSNASLVFLAGGALVVAAVALVAFLA